MTRGAVEILMPKCDICDKLVVASLCGVRPTKVEDVEALQAVLLAMHKKLAHPK